MNEKLPKPQEIKEAFDKCQNQKIDNFFDYNYNRIVEVLNDFIENPYLLPESLSPYFYIYKTGNIKLEAKELYKYEFKLDLILEKLKLNGYNCWLYAINDYGDYSRKIVTIKFDFNDKKNEDKKNLFSRIFNKIIKFNRELKVDIDPLELE